MQYNDTANPNSEQHIYTPNNGFKNGPKSSKPKPLLHELSLTKKKTYLKIPSRVATQTESNKKINSI